MSTSKCLSVLMPELTIETALLNVHSNGIQRILRWSRPITHRSWDEHLR